MNTYSSDLITWDGTQGSCSYHDLTKNALFNPFKNMLSDIAEFRIRSEETNKEMKFSCAKGACSRFRTVVFYADNDRYHINVTGFPN